MFYSFEDAAARMHTLAASDIAERLVEANEAETRLLLIDQVLEILGWRPEEYKPEQPTSGGGFTDYKLTINGKALLIVEAKRFGLVEPIAKILRKPQYQNATLRNSCGSKELAALLDQCRLYCSDCAITYAVATTGNIWIVLIGGNVGVEWGRLQAYVFHSLTDITERFNLFYDLISREAVRKGGLDEHFSSIRLVSPQAAIRPRSLIDNPSPLPVVPQRRALRAFFDTFMDDITVVERAEMLEYCYVDTSDVIEYSRDLRALLEYDAILDEQDESIPDVNKDDLKQEIEDQWASGRPKTILLVGKIGAGKSTFVHKFIREQASSGKHICVLINLIDQAITSVKQTRDEEQHLARLVLDSLFEKFRDKFDPFDPSVLRACFRTEIEQFKVRRKELLQRRQEDYILAEEDYLNSLCQDAYRHLIGYSQYIRNKRNKIWLILDNIDQGSYAYQEFIYTFAHRLSHDARCVVLVTLREDTFLEAQDAGFLNVRRSDVIFRLNSPELRQVIAKRRRYVDYVLNHGALPRSLKPHQTVVQVLNEHLRQLLLESDDRIRKCITALSLGSVRHSLQMLQDYYTSPHSSIHEYFKPEAIQGAKGVENSQFVLDLAREMDSFLQALMLKSNWSYDERDSNIHNLFAVDADIQRSHFIAVVILAYLTRESVSPKSSIKIDKLCGDLASFGYQRHHVIAVVKRMLLDSLLVSPRLPVGIFKRQDIPEISSDTRVAITARGYYYLNHLCKNPYYQVRVAEDTIWYNEDQATYYSLALQESHDSQDKNGNRDALLSTDALPLFREYLSQLWIQEYQSARARVQSEWARVVMMVEDRLFGKQLTQAITIADSEPSSSESVSAPEKRRVSALPSGALSAIGTSQPQQLQIFPNSGIDYEKAFKEAVQTLGAMPDGARVRKSTYLLRVLWAMEVSSRCGLPSVRASDIARIINKYGNGNVASPNVAKFFRGQRQSGEFAHLWDEAPDGTVTINRMGREILLGHLQDSTDGEVAL